MPQIQFEPPLYAIRAYFPKVRTARQSRADNLREALKCFARDVEFEKERNEYLAMLEQVNSELANVRATHSDAVSMREEMEMFRAEARDLELLEEIRFISNER